MRASLMMIWWWYIIVHCLFACLRLYFPKGQRTHNPLIRGDILLTLFPVGCAKWKCLCKLHAWREDSNSLLNKEVAHLRTGPPPGQWRAGAPPIKDWLAPLSTNQRALARSRGCLANRGQERPFSSTKALSKSTGPDLDSIPKNLWPIVHQCQVFPPAWRATAHATPHMNSLIYAPNTGVLSAKNTICSWFQAKALPRAFWT